MNQAAGRDSHATACSETIVTVVAVIVAVLAMWSASSLSCQGVAVRRRLGNCHAVSHPSYTATSHEAHPRGADPVNTCYGNCAMADTTFTIVCPCCDGKLTIDAELRAVIAHEPAPPKRAVADLGTALGALGTKAAEREARFRQQMEAESQKGKLLDRKFQEGLKKAKDTPDPPRRPFDFE